MEVAGLVHRSGGSIPLGKVIHGVSPATKQAVIGSGKGLEGFVRQFTTLLKVEVSRSEKRVHLVDPDLFQPAMPEHAKEDVPKTEEEVTRAAPPPPAAEVHQTEVVPTSPKAPTAAQATPVTTSFSPEEEKKNPDDEEARETPKANPPTSTSPSSVTNRPAGALNEEANGVDTEDEAMTENPDDPNFATRKRFLALLKVDGAYYNLNEIHQQLFRGAEVPYSDLVLYVRSSPQYFWYFKGVVARRHKHHTAAPLRDPERVVSVENIRRGYVRADGTPIPKEERKAPGAAATPPSDRLSNSPSTGTAKKTPEPGPTTSGAGAAAAANAEGNIASQSNNWLGWGAAANVPTSEDVFEILKYIPINWVNLGNLQFPPDIKKRHIRVGRALVWFARQPRYFDLRVVRGTIEIRRAVVLHPEAHNLTKEEAEAIVEKRIAADIEAGEPVPLLLARGATSATTTKASAAVAAAAAGGGSAPGGGAPAASQDAVTKILLRVCPGYFISCDTIIRRATKKLDTSDILECAARNVSHLDTMTVTSLGDPKIVRSLVRRKTGLESSKWEAGFKEELEKSPNLDALLACMSRCCAQWDRLHYIYVRLPDDVKIALGGFDGMVAFMKAHPHVFVVGEFFYKRIDSADPNVDLVEPTSNAVTSTKQLEDNPYHLSRELAEVFAYLTPEDQPCTLSHFQECSSPAMRAVLPPRLITVVQSHPELLTYREVSPGTYAISRSLVTDGVATLLSETETIEAVVKLVPPRGIDASHLMNSLPPTEQASVVKHFGRDGVLDLVARNPHLFHVVRNPPYVTLFLKKPNRAQR